MSNYEPKDNSGALFKNERKEKDSHPDYRGNCVVNGVQMDMAAWIKTSAKGTKYMSFSFSEPWQKPEPKPTPAQDFGGFDDESSDIPF
jgi:uncharacterized protein (DUF736 family)